MSAKDSSSKIKDSANRFDNIKNNDFSEVALYGSFLFALRDYRSSPGAQRRSDGDMQIMKELVVVSDPLRSSASFLITLGSLQLLRHRPWQYLFRTRHFQTNGKAGQWPSSQPTPQNGVRDSPFVGSSLAFSAAASISPETTSKKSTPLVRSYFFYGLNLTLDLLLSCCVGIGFPLTPLANYWKVLAKLPLQENRSAMAEELCPFIHQQMQELENEFRQHCETGKAESQCKLFHFGESQSANEEFQPYVRGQPVEMPELRSILKLAHNCQIHGYAPPRNDPDGFEGEIFWRK